MKAESQETQLTIQELADVSGVSIRNIRAYRNRGLLPPPERRGRHGIYTNTHLHRLKIITALLERGYSIANVDELIRAWQSGQSIEKILGLGDAAMSRAAQEVPQIYNVSDLVSRFGQQLSPAAWERILDLKVLRRKGRQFVADRPSLLETGAELVKMGFPLDEILDVLASLRVQMEHAAQVMADIVERDLLDSLLSDSAEGENPEVELARSEQMISSLRQIADRIVILENNRALDNAIQGIIRRHFDRTAARQLLDKI